MLQDNEDNELFDGMDDVDSFEGRIPKLGLGTFAVEITEASVVHSKKYDKDYFQVNFQILESDAPGFSVGSEACVQIWPAKFKIHQRKIKALVEAALPGKEVTAKLCNTLVKEGLLAGEKLRVRVVKNGKGYPEPEYKAY